MRVMWVLGLAAAAMIAGCETSDMDMAGEEMAATESQASSPEPMVPQRMCGTAHNATHNFSTPVEMTFAAGRFAGELKVPDTRYTGAGTFSGSMEGGQCRATTTGGLTMNGACPTDRYSAGYEISGQTGRIDVSTAGCAS